MATLSDPDPAVGQQVTDDLASKSKPTTVRVTPESVFALLRRRITRGCDADMDHAELFTRGGVLLCGPSTHPALLIYSIDKTAFFVRAACHADIHAFLLTEEPTKVCAAS